MRRSSRIGGVPLYQFDNGLQLRRLISVQSRAIAARQVGVEETLMGADPTTSRIFALVAPPSITSTFMGPLGDGLPDLALVVILVGQTRSGDLEVRSQGAFPLSREWLNRHIPSGSSLSSVIAQVDPLFEAYPRAILTALFGWLGLSTRNVGHRARLKLNIPIVDVLESYRVTNTSDEVRMMMWAELATADAAERFMGPIRSPREFPLKRERKEPRKWRLRQQDLLVEADIQRKEARWRVSRSAPQPTLLPPDGIRPFRKTRKTGWWPTLIDALADADVAVERTEWPEWLSHHRLRGHPLMDISSYHLLGILPPPLQPNDTFEEWLEAIYD